MVAFGIGTRKDRERSLVEIIKIVDGALSECLRAQKCYDDDTCVNVLASDDDCGRRRNLTWWDLPSCRPINRSRSFCLKMSSQGTDARNGLSSTADWKTNESRKGYFHITRSKGHWYRHITHRQTDSSNEDIRPLSTRSPNTAVRWFGRRIRLI